MIQNVQSNANIRKLSNEELGRIIENCEHAIANGAAQIDDYEAFVLCQKELARRTWT